MMTTLYLIILAYFVVGGISFYFINRKRDQEKVHANRVKYITYFFIINIIFFSIVIIPGLFVVISLLIIIMGLFEISRLFFLSGYREKVFFLAAFVLFVFISVGFLRFSILGKSTILYTFLLLSIFDSFSQISGQLFGRNKLFPAISPEKTIEGVVGGLMVTLISSVYLSRLVEGLAVDQAFWMALGIVSFAFMGDAGTSYFKRRYNVKDFSAMIPGHGGFLDRFDSMIAGGAFVALIEFIK
jgi:phosphatidate cytidylyltransferase